jgi:hypothetical protein
MLGNSVFSLLSQMTGRFTFVFVACALGLAQQAAQQSQQQKQPPPPAEKKPSPLFSGQLGLKSSQKTKESATLGFNGIDPSGKVEASMLAAAPNDKEKQQVKQLDAAKPSDSDLQEFLQQGGLNKR